MRDYKFRGKRIDNGEWVYGHYHFDDSGDGFDAHYITVKHDLDVLEVDPKTVGQYTGLKDKNGKEVFEGDILEVTSELLTNLGRTRTGVMSTTYYEVLWREEGWGKKVIKSGQLVLGSITDGIKISAKYATVYGSIYDNPELLQGGTS